MKNRSAMSDATRGRQLRAWLRRTPRRRVLSPDNLTTNLWNGSAGRLLRGAAPQIGVTLAAILMDGPFQEAQYLEGFRTATGNGARALLVGPVAEHFVNRRLIVKLAAQNQLPAVASGVSSSRSGGLMACGVSTPDNGRRAAGYVDKILKGTKPADLPVEQPTRFELVINMRTAKALGLTIPTAVLARADEIVSSEQADEPEDRRGIVHHAGDTTPSDGGSMTAVEASMRLGLTVTLVTLGLLTAG